jgi:pyruvate,water dikinase
MAGYFNWADAEWEEERDLGPRYKVWVFSVDHTVRATTIFDLWLCLRYFDLVPFGCDAFQVPTSIGSDYRLKDGCIYATVILPPEEERPQREAEFRKRIRPWIEDFKKEYNKGSDVILKEAAKLKALVPEKMTDGELKRAFEDWIEFYNRVGQIHFTWMYAFCIAYGMFEDLCKDLLGMDMHQRLFNDLMGGFDNKYTESDRVQWQLGKLANELGLEPIFQSTADDRQLLAKIDQAGEPGKKWLSELRKFVEEYGWRTGLNWDISTPSWVEEPSRALPGIRTYITQPTYAVDDTRPSLVKAREEAEREVLSRVPQDQREWFAKLMKGAQNAGVGNEEHPFYTEQLGNSLGRHVFKEIEKRFAKWGVVKEPRDTYYLLPEEIDIRLILRFDALKTVEIRKKQHAEFRGAIARGEVPPVLGNPEAIPEVLPKDPMFLKTVVSVPYVRPELKADVYGTVGTPGCVEGIARVILDESEFREFKLGEILVTKATSAVWTPLFTIAKAVVTDGGGSLSHAAIVGRECGIPVVAGTMEGTRKIKTGMRIRVDGDKGAVYILDKG